MYGCNLLINLSFLSGGSIWPTHGSRCPSENRLFVQWGIRDQDSCPWNYWWTKCCYYWKQMLIFILALRVGSAILVDCPVSLCPTTDAVLKKLLSASAFQSYCFLSTLLVQMRLLKVQCCYKYPYYSKSYKCLCSCNYAFTWRFESYFHK